MPTDLRDLFDLQFQASRRQIDVPLVVRRERLVRLRKLLGEHAPELSVAVEADFGVRSAAVTEMAELSVLRALLSDALRQLPRWTRRRRISTPWYLHPAQAWVQPQPLGVVGVMAPWNYPLLLSLAPVVAAFAAGNRVMLKPSERAPHTAAQLARLAGRFFSPEEFGVATGGVAVATAFAGLPFDHLFFTGSSQTGRRVAQAAAVHLTPTTLELGGKSPCIIDAGCDLHKAAASIAHGKLLNAGQTCVAPDYVLVPRGSEAAFADAFRAAALRLYPRFAGNPDYASVVDAHHHARLQALLQNAAQLGAQVEVIEPADADGSNARLQRQMAPVLVYGVTDGMRLMQEEIFGPVLPVLSYERLDDAIDYVNARPRPLALYWFGDAAGMRDEVLRRTVSGGVTVNGTLLHAAHPGLPFGGVGDSGWGAAHGEAGFRRMSHDKAVLAPARGNPAAQWLRPPYGARFQRISGLLRRWL
nr:aldehyde dehydrogenase family protein [Xylophilus sp.]